ncbi:DNA-3-methyladenine glycosylase I [Robiginitalea marina]|uniref:DNA-3-methyladenine glycosylase I n=1 Tax=Robiginitalea marina TaxID=2954105 RepID=A0ABT1AWX4_9FLAO|nr:DNA-3-methyladenine glycosylase I [Robiginitalea marina]MCO5724540.1 DNA-3-methyladenine glycosylase I [Robiginitalea marina]
MEIIRCGWCAGSALYEAYHDKEWGVPVRDDALLFEFLLLETFQAGLSWITVLKKREEFRKAFDGFDYQAISQYGPEKVASLMENPGIIRNRLKIQGSITNSRAYIKVREEFGTFSDYFWGFTGGQTLKNNVQDYWKAPSTTPLSDQISKDLKKRGFTFVGSTVVYAYMQATGMVNDHEINCFRYHEV